MTSSASARPLKTPWVFGSEVSYGRSTLASPAASVSVYAVPLSDENSSSTVITFLVNLPLRAVGSSFGSLMLLNWFLSLSTPLLKTFLNPLNTVLIAGRPIRSYWVFPLRLVVEPQMPTFEPMRSLSSFRTIAFVFRLATKSVPFTLTQNPRPQVACTVLLKASRSKKNGSERGPANARFDPASPPGEPVTP